MRRRRDPSLPPPPAKKAKGSDAKPSIDDLMSVLFETPSGFAIFHCWAPLIEIQDVLEVLWDKFTDYRNAQSLVLLKQFKTFEDKSSAITHIAGVNEMLSQMIHKCHFPGTKLAVGKTEYKQIIEKCLNIPCVHNPAVMELMWGIQNCMQSLVPKEKNKLTEADRLPISQGLRTVLSRYDCLVEPKMVTELIVKAASALFRSDSVEKENSTRLRTVGLLIKDVSGINCDGWSLLKIATALKAIWCPEEIGDSFEMISENEVSRLVKDRRQYELILDKYACLGCYEVMMSSHCRKMPNKSLLEFLAEQSNKAK